MSIDTKVVEDLRDEVNRLRDQINGSEVVRARMRDALDWAKDWFEMYILIGNMGPHHSGFLSVVTALEADRVVIALAADRGEP